MLCAVLVMKYPGETESVRQAVLAEWSFHDLRQAEKRYSALELRECHLLSIIEGERCR